MMTTTSDHPIGCYPVTDVTGGIQGPAVHDLHELIESDPASEWAWGGTHDPLTNAAHAPVWPPDRQKPPEKRFAPDLPGGLPSFNRSPLGPAGSASDRAHDSEHGLRTAFSTPTNRNPDKG